MDDDFEIEVTDLHTGAITRHPLTNQTSGESDRGNLDDDDDDGGDDDSMPLRSTTLRRHRLRAAIVSGVVLLAVVLVVAINPTAKSSLYTVFRFPTPVPSPTPLPGANVVYLTHGAPWGIVTLDGGQAPVANLGMTSAWIKLTPGHHTITVTQAPFPTLRCAISMPAASSDNCPLISPLNNQNGQLGGIGAPGSPGSPDLPPGSRFIDLGARFDLLPSAAQDALVAAVSAKLQPPSGAPVTLQPGDHYLRDDGSPAIAQEPLRALFIPTLLPPATSIPSDGPSCVSFCDLTGIGMSSGGTWDMVVSLLGSWRITTATGQVVANHAPMYSHDTLYAGLSPAVQVALSILWTGNWQVSERTDFGYGYSPVCQAAQDMMGAILGNGNTAITGMGTQAARTPEQGCLISLTLSDPTKGAPIYIYYHFGMLLAANDAAHSAFPSLPVASAAERALMRQILASPYYP